jgi:hypothetical protein
MGHRRVRAGALCQVSRVPTTAMHLCSAIMRPLVDGYKWRFGDLAIRLERGRGSGFRPPSSSPR